jgi:aminoglycoside phosphotransferase (APT) family kinase protein
MEYVPVARPSGAFQQTVPAADIEAMCRRAFGPGTSLVSAVELGGGCYNTTYRVTLAGADQPVILRVAPAPGRQFRVERELMRAEHAVLPFLSPIAPLIPRTLAADFTHEVIGRDYLFQTMLDGVPGPEGIASYPSERHGALYRQLGEITRLIHQVRGVRFGPAAGPWHASWSEAVVGYFTDLAADLDDLSLDSSDVRQIAAAAGRDRAVLDEVTVPRLLHGDLWTVNVMLDPGADEPVICGVFDNDRASWGDPEADWPVYLASLKPGTARDAFWDGYGTRPSGAAAARRSLYYLARHIGAIRLELHRLGNAEKVPQTYEQMHGLLARLTA